MLHKSEKEKTARKGETSSGRQRVQIKPTTPASLPDIDVQSIRISMRTSGATYVDVLRAETAMALINRENYKLTEGFGRDAKDLTPYLLQDFSMNKRLGKLLISFEYDNLEKEPPLPQEQQLLALAATTKPRISWSPRISPVNLDKMLVGHLEHVDEEEEKSTLLPSAEKAKRVQPYVKITLKRTPELLLLENRSVTMPRGTKEAEYLEEQNKLYEYLTTGKGRMRRTNDLETQTTDVLYKTRETSMEQVEKNFAGTFVSNYEMIQTYKKINSVSSVLWRLGGGDKSLKLSTYNTNDTDNNKLEDIFDETFQRAAMITQRILARNIFEQEQNRFRNMITQDPLAPNCNFMYTLNLLFRLQPITSNAQRKSVADLSFCPGNGDIIAVAYGIYSFETMSVPDSGYCCIWNIKNPVHPERVFHYNTPVVSVEFSPYMPQLLAIGLYDGSVEVRDISTSSTAQPVGVSQRTEFSTRDPITAIVWVTMRTLKGVQKTEIDPLLALSADGSVTKFRLINSPYLLAFKQIQLDRVVGSPEGLAMRRDWKMNQSNRSPQGLNIMLHPQQSDIYYVLTDEGCFFKASTNYPNQYLQILQTHNGTVNCMDFSPWSPKLFLTAGNDWCIRIWFDGITKPLITLRQQACRPVHCAAWSKTHSTVIVSNSREYVNVWDIRRSINKPISSTTFDKSHLTQFKFSRCGRSMALGNERGQVLMLSFEDMPFPARAQYNELELAIFKAISADEALTSELQSFGFFGYTEQQQRKCQH